MSHVLKGGETYLSLRREKLSLVLKGGKKPFVKVSKRRENRPFTKEGKLVACTKRRENLSFAEVKHVACAKRRENEPVTKAGKHRTCSIWRENEPSVSQKPKLERDFLKKGNLCPSYAVIS